MSESREPSGEPKHNLRQATKTGTYWCADELGMMCDGNWEDVRSWQKHVDHADAPRHFVHGIAWSRDEVIPPIWPEDVQWFDTYGEALAEFNSRDDKYWPSILVKASLGPAMVVLHGTCPEYLAGGDQ